MKESGDKIEPKTKVHVNETDFTAEPLLCEAGKQHTAFG